MEVKEEERTMKKLTPAQNEVVEMLKGGGEVVATRLNGGHRWTGRMYHFATMETVSMSTLNALVSRGLIRGEDVKSTRRLYSLCDA